MSKDQTIINDIKKHIDRIEVVKKSVRNQMETINFSLGEINVLLKKLSGNDNFKGYDQKCNDEYFDFINKPTSGLT